LKIKEVKQHGRHNMTAIFFISVQKNLQVRYNLQDGRLKAGSFTGR